MVAVSLTSTIGATLPAGRGQRDAGCGRQSENQLCTGCVVAAVCAKRTVLDKILLRLPRRIANPAQHQIATGREIGLGVAQDEDRAAIDGRADTANGMAAIRGLAWPKIQHDAADGSGIDVERTAHVGQCTE